MKVLKPILIIVVVVIGAVLISALFISKDFSHEESLTINAPVMEVWNHTNTLEKMDEWSPWTSQDPDIKLDFTGEAGTVGSKNCWDSQNENVGAGCQTITKVSAPYALETHLDFTRPQESQGDAYVRLAETDGGTTVTWGIESEFDYPFNFFLLFMSAEEMMGPDFQKGLGKLKDMVES